MVAGCDVRPRNLRWFGQSALDKTWTPEDTNWAVTLHRIASAATKLETLVMYNGCRFDANATLAGHQSNGRLLLVSIPR